MAADADNKSGEFGPDAFKGQEWHTVDADEALKLLRTTEEGLSDEEVAERRELFGRNKLPRAKKTSLILVIVRQFKDPLVYVLLAAGALSLAIQHWSDAIFVFAVLALNATIGTIQEWKAETGAEALEEVIKIKVKVERAGEGRKLESADLVPGDIVDLKSGDSVPADLRLLRTKHLLIDESLLTGESESAEKDADITLQPEAGVGDRQNIAHAGTLVVDGRGRGVVCKVGAATEVGRIASSLGGEATAAPLVIRLRKFTRWIAAFILGALVLLSVGQVLRGAGLVETLLLASALAVSAIPAGLPVAITVALSIATHRMAKRNVIVRLLPAVEGLGAATLIASDKTGTLTANQLTIRRLRPATGPEFEVEGEGLELSGEVIGVPEEEKDSSEGPEETELARLRRMALTGVLCNEGELRVKDDEVRESGDKVDIAFLVLAHKLGIDQTDAENDHPQVDYVPFESGRRFAASFNEGENGQVIAHVKGAAETVAPMCKDVDPEEIERVEDELAAEGYRVLAVASGPVEGASARDLDVKDLKELEFLGLVGMIDPIRRQVPDAVECCRRARVEPRMVTGDHPRTGYAIARRLGMVEDEGQVVTGAEIKEESGEGDEGEEREKRKERRERILNSRVFARVEPLQKTTIVRTLQEAGHFVAVTGDGVNDAPALEEAHIGVAMGKTGTDVARRAADLIITDDNFASIVSGIREGRVAYDNVRKVTWLLISTGAAEVILFFLSLATGLPLPLTVVQLLWLNLVTNGIQDVALAFEHEEKGVLDRPPRPPSQGILDRRMIEETALSGGVIGLTAFGVFYLLFEVFGWGEFAARNALLLLMVLFENMHAFNCRSERSSIFKVSIRANYFLVATIVAAQGLHIGAMFIPGLNDVLEVQPVSVVTWLILFGVALILPLCVELYKLLRREGPAEARSEGVC